MSEIRSRKQTGQKQKDQTAKRNDKSASSTSQQKSDSRGGILAVISVGVGIIAMVTMGYIHARYMTQIHENWMWFSNIKVGVHVR